MGGVLEEELQLYVVFLVITTKVPLVLAALMSITLRINPAISKNDDGDNHNHNHNTEG